MCVVSVSLKFIFFFKLVKLLIVVNSAVAKKYNNININNSNNNSNSNINNINNNDK